MTDATAWGPGTTRPIILEEPTITTIEHPLVRVHWEDATNVAEWMPLADAVAFEDVDFDYRCTNVGYLIRDDTECVIVAARATGDHKAVGLTERIPRGMVTSIEYLAPVPADWQLPPGAKAARFDGPS